MRKIILAAAAATAVLGLSACGGSTESETDETVEAMNADAEASADEGAAIESVATQSAADIQADAKEAADDAVKTTDETADDALSVVEKAEEEGAE